MNKRQYCFILRNALRWRWPSTAAANPSTGNSTAQGQSEERLRAFMRSPSPLVQIGPRGCARNSYECPTALEITAVAKSCTSSTRRLSNEAGRFMGGHR